MTKKFRKEWVGKMKIIFTNVAGLDNIFPPEPALKNIPSWYKEVASYVNNGEKKPSGQGTTTATIKKCMPVFDVITSGYIIKSAADIYVSRKEDFDENGKSLGLISYYEWASLDAIQFHPTSQLPNYPNTNGNTAYPKFINFWSIETPKGYSCLFTQPVHRDLPFTIFPGVVDTDRYTSPVNFPFVLNDINWEGLIPAGTPIAQVIPFKRDNWNMEIGKEKNIKKSNDITTQLKTRFFDSYKNQFRSGTTYR